MSAAVVTVRPPTALALLLTVAAVLLIGSGVSYTLLQARSAAAGSCTCRSMRSTAWRWMPAPRWPAMRRRSRASSSARRSSRMRPAHDPAAPFTSDARFTRLMNNATAVLRARSALADAGSAARETAALVPRLLTESGALGASLPSPVAPAVTATLERFEARAQRLQLDVSRSPRARPIRAGGRSASPRAATTWARSSPASQAAARVWRCRA